ncbi:MAG: DUF6067 family protein [Armatimonadota bacterium]|nr:DUF6067 family protein [Armatimonadota bacterium]
MNRVLCLLVVLIVLPALSLMPVWGLEMSLTSDSFEVWVLDPLVKALPGAEKPAGSPQTVTINAVRNEFESAQIVVLAKSDIRKLTVSVLGSNDLKVTANFIGLVPVRKGTPETPTEHLIVNAPAEVPDPLLAKRSVSVSEGKVQPIWLTVYVPKDAKPGKYTVDVQVKGDRDMISVPLTINVSPVTLPDERTLYVTNWFFADPIARAHGLTKWSEPFWKILETYAQFMADHRQNVASTPVFELVKPDRDHRGRLAFDFSDFDRWVELFRKVGIVTIEGHPATPDQENSIAYSPESGEKPEQDALARYQRFTSRFFPALQKHLEEKGWLDSYVQHIRDEPVAATAAEYKKMASFVRQYAPKIRIIEASMCTEVAGAIDVWVVQPPHYESAVGFLDARRKAGEDVWFYTCCGPRGKYMNRFIDFPLLDVRLLHWANFKYGLTGYLHWGYNFWRGDPFNDLEPEWVGQPYLPPGDTHIIYPGLRGPLSSIRLEAMRDGIEDYELLKLLEKKNPKEAKGICDSVVKSFSEYTLDTSVFRAARSRLVEALEGHSVVSGRPRPETTPAVTVKVISGGEPAAKAGDCRRTLVGPGVNQPDPFPGYAGFVGWESPIRLKNGTLLVGFNAGWGHASYPTPEAPTGGRAMLIRSTDGGKSWSKPETIVDTPYDDRHPNFCELPDGTLLCTFFTYTGGDATKQPDEAHRATIVRSLDGGRTWEKTPRRPPSPFFGDATDGPIITLKDGSALLAVYGGNANDENTQIAVFKSKNRGKTWTWLSTVKTDHEMSEPSVAQLKDGRLVLITRPEGDICWSEDGGKTWTKPVSFGVRMYEPGLLLLKDGTLLCLHGSYGAGGLRVILSRDGGHTWLAPAPNYGFPVDTSVYGYGKCIELPDGSVFAVYINNIGLTPEDMKQQAIWGIRFRVRRDYSGIDVLPAPLK